MQLLTGKVAQPPRLALGAGTRYRYHTGFPVNNDLFNSPAIRRLAAPHNYYTEKTMRKIQKNARDASPIAHASTALNARHYMTTLPLYLMDVLMSVGILPMRVWVGVLAAALLGGCGGGSDNPPTATETGLVATAIRQTAPVSVCPNGGISVDAGIDKDANGVLDAAEVTATQVVCHGANGNRPMATTTPEAAGANCSAGGHKVSVGLDSNGNNVLDETEIISSSYVCNGANGNNGLGTLLTIVAELVGANCPSGGSRVSSGLDSNNSGVLDAAEVTSTRYVCNSQLWTGVSSGPLQTLPNQGYTALSVTTPLVLTLPVNPAVNDTLHVVGAGAAGWQLVQNAGQSIVTSSLGAAAVSLASVGATWGRETTHTHRVLAASADGLRLITGDSSRSRSVKISSDGGATWTVQTSLPSPARWIAVASSADGLKLVAAHNDEIGAITGTGRIYTSSNGGATWTARGPSLNWSAVASSANGARLVAADVGPGGAGGQLYTSDDAGVTWIARESPRQWASLASSADGMRLVAADSGLGGAGGLLYTSSDAGVTWMARASTQVWRSVASSADGNKLVAAALSGQLHTSSDAGVTWIARNAGPSATDLWWAVASSTDGNRLVAATGFTGTGRGIFTSTDSGVTWIRTPALSQNWQALASSADGSRIFAADDASSLYISVAQAHVLTTTVGTGGALSGGQYSAVDLQYTGNGQWIILDHQGTLFVQ